MNDYDKELDKLLLGVIVAVFGVVFILLSIGYLLGKRWGCG